MSEQHLRISNFSDLPLLSGLPVLPLAAGSCPDGPCTILPHGEQVFEDIVHEAIEQFRLKSLFRREYMQMHLLAPVDQILWYLIDWIRWGVLNNMSSSTLHSPPAFSAPNTQCYLAQLRSETARRLVEDKLSPWWAQYA